jgi:hypothetical protein
LVVLLCFNSFNAVFAFKAVTTFLPVLASNSLSATLASQASKSQFQDFLDLV